MRTEKAHSGQSLWDMALQHCGTADAAFNIARMNGMTLTGNPVVGTEYSIPEATNRKVTRHYSEHGDMPATWHRNSTNHSFVWSDPVCVESPNYYNYSWSSPTCVEKEPHHFTWNTPVCVEETGRYGFVWSEPTCIEVKNHYEHSWSNPVCVQTGPPYRFSWINGICAKTTGSYRFGWTNSVCAKRIPDWTEWEEI